MPKKRRVLRDPFKDTGGEPRPPLPSVSILFTFVVTARFHCSFLSC